MELKKKKNHIWYPHAIQARSLLSHSVNLQQSAALWTTISLSGVKFIAFP